MNYYFINVSYIKLHICFLLLIKVPCNMVIITMIIHNPIHPNKFCNILIMYLKGLTKYCYEVIFEKVSNCYII